jgi:MFS family permease
MASHAIDPIDPTTERSPIAGFGLARRAMIVAACFAATLSAALIYDVLPPIMADLSAHFGGGATGSFVAQLASTLPLFGVMIGGLCAGPLIERFGLRPTLLAAMALFGLAGSAGIALDQVVPFLGSRVAMGFAAGMMTTACTSLVAIFFRGAPRARMNGLIISAGSIGGIVFVLIAGWTAVWWWRAPFLLHGAIVLVFLLPVLLTGPVPAAAPVAPSAIINFKRLRPILPVCAVGFGWFVIMLMGGAKTPFVMAEAGITNHATIASLYAINAGSVTVSSLIFGNFASRFPPVSVVRVAFLLNALALCIVGTASAAPQFALGMSLGGISTGVALTAIWTWGMRRAPHDLVARSLGTMTMALYLGGALSTVLTAPYQAAFGTRGQYLAVAATIVVLVTLSLLARRKRALATA